jgi:hypothetical protein
MKKAPKAGKLDDAEKAKADEKGTKSTSFKDSLGQTTVATTCECGVGGCEKCRQLGFVYA